MSAYAKLSARPRKFVDAYVRRGVAFEAYREVYTRDGKEPKRPDVSAAKLMRREDVKAAIAERTEIAVARAGVRQVRVLEELAALAFADVGELFDANGSLKAFDQMTREARATISAIDTEELLETVDKERRPYGIVRKLKTHPKVEALKLLLQYLRLLPERHEHSGPNGAPIPIDDAAGLSDLDRARRVAFLLARGVQLNAAASAPNTGNPAGSPQAPSNKQETQP